jgi:hypothetical protein
MLTIAALRGLLHLVPKVAAIPRHDNASTLARMVYNALVRGATTNRDSNIGKREDGSVTPERRGLVLRIFVTDKAPEIEACHAD